MTHDAEGPSAASAGSKPLTFGSLFAGIGGFDLGLERAGMVCKWQVEIDNYATKILEKHWPTVRRWNDVRTFPPEGDWNVDVICGGFPCQDISVAGKGAGLAGARSGLWYEYARIVGELRPRYVIVENVAALLTRGMDAVLGTLSSLGYDAEWHVIPASAVGAPHRRERVWIVAYAHDESESDVPQHDEPWRGVPESAGGDVSNAIGQRDAMRGNGSPCSQGVAGRHLHAGGGERDSGPRCAGQAGQSSCDVADADEERRRGRAGMQRQSGRGQPADGCCQVADADEQGLEGRSKPRRRSGKRDSRASGGTVSGWWESEPDVGRVAHGVPARVDRLRCLGNAVVPQVVEVIGRAIVARG